MMPRGTMALLLVLTAFGCGAHNVVVDLTHPAAIDFHNAAVLAAAVSDVPAPISYPDFTVSLRQSLTRGLTTVIRTIPVPPGQNARIRTTRDAQDIAVATGADHLIHATVLECGYAEQLTKSEIRQFNKPSAYKVVRTGKTRAVLYLAVYRLSDGVLLQADTLEREVTVQQKAVDADPDGIDTLRCFVDLANALASEIVDLATPVKDKAVITFMTNGSFPEIEDGIGLIERGDWPGAERLFTEIAMKRGKTDGVDEVWYDLGLVRQHLHDFRGAEEAFENAIDIRERSRYRQALVILDAAEREYQEAVDQGLEK